jgi:hypothetical protein
LVVSDVLLLEELGIEELLDDDGVLLDDEDDGELEPLELVSEPVALPLIELEELGGVALLLLEDPGVVLLVVSVALELELGDDGMLLVEDGDVADVLLLVPDLLRSQPVTAAVATARTATNGMSLFMTSPFECGWWGVRRFPRGTRDCSGSTGKYTHNACHPPLPLGPADGGAIPFRNRGKLSGNGGKRLPGRVGRTPTPPTRLYIIQIMRPAAGS